MPIRSYKPTSPGRRGMTVASFDDVTTDRPYKPLTERLQKHAGRNSQGKITTRHRGGGSKRLYRIVDWKRDKAGVPARVQTIEYDPNRSARIALLAYADGEKRYILAPIGVRVGDTLAAGPGVEIRPGNAMPLRHMPVGTVIHNVELYPGRGGQMVRSAGTAAQLMAKEATTPRSACPRASSGASTPTARRRSGRWATSTTPTSRWARRAARAGWAGAPPCGGRR